MQPAGVGAHALLHEGEEGDDVVLGDLLNLLDAAAVVGGEVPRAGLAVLQGLLGGDAVGHHALEGGQLHVAPAAIAGLVTPERGHLLA